MFPVTAMTLFTVLIGVQCGNEWAVCAEIAMKGIFSRWGFLKTTLDALKVKTVKFWLLLSIILPMLIFVHFLSCQVAPDTHVPVLKQIWCLCQALCLLLLKLLPGQGTFVIVCDKTYWTPCVCTKNLAFWDYRLKWECKCFSYQRRIVKTCSSTEKNNCSFLKMHSSGFHHLFPSSPHCLQCCQVNTERL